jgi:hypothetical protein
MMASGAKQPRTMRPLVLLADVRADQRWGVVVVADTLGRRTSLMLLAPHPAMRWTPDHWLRPRYVPNRSPSLCLLSSTRLACSSDTGVQAQVEYRSALSTVWDV